MRHTNFFLLTLLLGLLTLGSTSAWANDYELHNPIGADGYYIVKWDCANNTWASSNDMEVDETFTFAIDITGNDYLLNSVANKANPFIAFRKYIGNDYSDGGVYNDNTNRLTRITGNIFGATYNFKLMDSGKTPAKIWAEFWNASDTWDWDGRKRITSPGKDGLIKFATSTDRDDPCGSIDWTEGSTFDGWWADDNSHKGYTDPCVCASGGGDSGPTLTNWSFHGDMWLNGTGDNAGWVSGNNPNTPHFMDNGDGTATCSFIFPDAKCRLELFDNASVKTSNRCDGTTNLTTPEWNPNKYTFAATGSTKKYTFTLNLTSGHFTASAGAYTVQKTGWHVFMSAGGDDDPTEVGTITEEAGLVISDVASGNHNLYITDGSATTIAGVNWFGGLYIDKNNSDVAWATQREYYGDGKFSSTQFPIRGKRNAIGRFNLPTASDIIIAFDGGKITINKYVAPTPANTYTVTIHPNGGTAVSPLSVGEGQTISSISSTYGNGTAKWYKDEELTQEFILGTSTVTEDMDLYAKWGVSGNYYVAGSLWIEQNNTSGNWYSERAKLMTYPNNGSFGTASVTYVGHRGKNVIEIIKDKDWGKSQRDLDSNSPVSLSIENNHIVFTLSEAKQVTVSYNGKVSVSTSDVSLGDYTIWRIKTNGWGGQAEWAHNLTLESDGTHIFRDVPAGGNKQFTVTKGSDDMENVGINVFHALYINTTIPTQPSALTWTMQTAKLDANAITIQAPQSDNFWRNGVFSLSEQSDLKLTFDGGNISIDVLPKYTVSFNSNGGSEVASQTMFEGRTASEPADPDRDGYEFDSWRIGSVEGDEYDFESPVTANITLVAKWNQVIKHTVTFDSNGGSPVDAQDVIENETATEPAEPTRDNYTFGGWKLGNVLYNFSTPVTGNITLVADWSYTPAHISSVSINESSIYTWEGDATTYTLVPTLVPADIASVTVSWSSSDNNVATVENGVITPQGAGTATITCTATDYYSGSRTATCAVKVAPCAKALADAPSYSVTITGRDSYEGGSATLTGLWNPSVDNSEPAEFTAYQMTITPGKDGIKRYLYADASDNYVKRSTSSSAADNYYWIKTKVGTTGSGLDVYNVKNYGTGKYLAADGTSSITQNWYAHRAIVQENPSADVAKWYFIANCAGGELFMNVQNSDGNNDYSTHEMFLHVDTELNQQTINYNMSDESVVAVGSSDGCQGRNAHKTHFENSKSISNPAYIQSQMNSSYYRMKANATVQANLGSALAEADVISVELYADAATSVTLCKTNGDVVATINLNADAATEYTYLVTAGTMLDGESAFIIKAADNHAGIRSIAVTPMVTADPAQPDLHWTTTPVTAHLLLDGNFTYTAASSDSKGAISYASEDTDVAQVNASTGEVTPSGAGTTNIIATITADECYTTYSISYEVSFLGLQDYINTDGVNSVTLPGDYTSENIVVNKPFTIDGAGHAIGNLTVKTEGDLTLGSALTVNDFSIYGKAGNTTTPAASGQVRNATNLTVNGEAYFLYTVDPSGTVHFGWYDFTVPFRVNVMTGIAGIENEVLNEDFVNERNYAIMEHLGEKQAAGQYAYKKFRGVMEPCRLYSITLDPQNNYNTIRFQKADGDLVAGNEVTLNTYASTVDDKHANWNGVGNGTLHHADAAGGLSVGYVQVYQSGNKTFLPVERSNYSFVIGSAFMVQQAGSMTLTQATHSPLLAPKREASVQPTAIQIASEGQPFSDQLFISADEMAGQGYTQGVDVAKAGNIGNVNVPQIWTNAYNSKLCAHEARLINGQARFDLSLYAPADGSYTLISSRIPEDKTLYLTYNGKAIWNLSVGETYTLDLNQGTTTEYGLLLVENYKMPTAVENIGSQADETQKIMHNGILYILRNGKVFNAQGAVMK